MPQFVQTEQQKELIASLIQDLPAYRKKMRMSQAELGDAVGKSRQKISEMERGTAPLGWDTYLAILLVLGAPILNLLHVCFIYMIEHIVNHQ